MHNTRLLITCTILKPFQYYHGYVTYVVNVTIKVCMTFIELHQEFIIIACVQHSIMLSPYETMKLSLSNFHAYNTLKALEYFNLICTRLITSSKAVTKPRATFCLETTLWVPYYPYSTNLGNGLTCVENFLSAAYCTIQTARISIRTCVCVKWTKSIPFFKCFRKHKVDSAFWYRNTRML